MSVPSSSSYLTNLFGLRGKTALVTGGTRGIGAGFTIALASAGANIILLQRSPSSGQDVKDAVEALGRTCDSYACDLVDRKQVTEIVGQICGKDGREVDILVNCGGMTHRSPAEDFPEEKWDEIIQVNLTSSFLLARTLAKHWLMTSLSSQPKQQKKIINIASVLTFTGSVETPAYVATKGAIGQLTKALSNEWTAKGICVNAIAPGYIATDLTERIREMPEYEKAILGRVPAKRWGIPEDLAGAIIYLSSKARFEKSHPCAPINVQKPHLTRAKKI
ncbi:MAG: hypothetical protein M1819_002973 [Sarea resinae]|nr:MAG: hypothetical protein M1819_002973 [Sarea resinae]